MSEITILEDGTHIQHKENHGTGKIWKVFWLLSFITIIELGLGYFLYAKGTDISYGTGLATKIAIGVLTVLKAYYIVSVFMHLGDEVRNLIMTIVVPLVLFVWFIIAFLWDGDSWRNLRNSNAGSIKTEQKSTAAPVKAGEKP
jgi:cytochrome c oxidase subunit IV